VTTPHLLLTALVVALTAAGPPGCRGPERAAEESAPAPGGAAPTPGRNLLLITLDTMRADRLGAYGYAPAHTPALDALAASGTLFEQAFTSCPLTLPAHASVFTGLLPPEHGLRVNGGGALPGDIPVLADILAKHGYRTGAFVAAFVVDSKFGLDRGFEVYDDDLAGAYEQEVPEELSVYRSGALVTTAALGWLGEVAEKGRPFFAWVHLYDTHYPYFPHDELAGTPFEGKRSYDAEVAFVDLQVGRLMRLLEERRLVDQTLVIAFGDHGEGLLDHGEVQHGFLLNEEVLRVPLVVRLPGVARAGQRVSSLVSLVDLLPTILDVLGIAAELPGGGRSLRPALAGGELPGAPSYAETEFPHSAYGWSPLRSLTTERWKYIRTTRPELYDRERDPCELYNLASARPADARSLEEQLAQVEGGIKPRTPVETTLSAGQKERLASLGYVDAGGGNERPRPETPLKDIKDMLATKQMEGELITRSHKGAITDEEVLEVSRELVRRSPETASFQFRLGTALATAGETEVGIRHLTEALRLRPDYPTAHNNLGNALARLGREDEAIEHYREALRLDPEFAQAHFSMGNALAARDHLDTALGHYAEAVRLNPEHADAHFNMGNTLARRRKLEPAIEHYEAALRLRPDFAVVHYNFANLLVEVGRPDAGIAHYREAITLKPDFFDAHNNLGVALFQRGELAAAEEHYRAALRLNPRFPRPHTNLGQLFEGQGKLAQAAHHYGEAVRLTPHDPDPARRLAWLLATADEPAVRDGPRAVTLAEQAVALTQRRGARVLDALAAAYAEVGRFEDAVAAAKDAVRLAAAQSWDDLAAEMRLRLEKYRAGRPHRAPARPAEATAAAHGSSATN